MKKRSIFVGDVATGTTGIVQPTINDGEMANLTEKPVKPVSSGMTACPPFEKSFADTSDSTNKTNGFSAVMPLESLSSLRMTPFPH